MVGIPILFSPWKLRRHGKKPMSFYFKKAIQCVFQGISFKPKKKIRDFHILNLLVPCRDGILQKNPHTPHRGNPRSNLYRTSPLVSAERGGLKIRRPIPEKLSHQKRHHVSIVYIICPSKIEWDLTNRPQRRLLELLNTQV